jgi:hypothetical protein
MVWKWGIEVCDGEKSAVALCARWDGLPGVCRATPFGGLEPPVVHSKGRGMAAIGGQSWLRQAMASWNSPFPVAAQTAFSDWVSQAFV